VQLYHVYFVSFHLYHGVAPSRSANTASKDSSEPTSERVGDSELASEDSEDLASGDSGESKAIERCHQVSTVSTSYIGMLTC
jgi:hypothetical protein